MYDTSALRSPYSLTQLAGAFFVLCLFSVVLPVPTLGAQSQNEIVTSVVYDGTIGFIAADGVNDFDVATGLAPEPHTPGQDAGANNGVVRTWDTFAFRVDWNVNEAAATGVVLHLVLPDTAEFVPDESGVLAGCDPLLSVLSADRHSFDCHLGERAEGSNGTVRAIAQQLYASDGTTFTPTATLRTTDDPAGVSDSSEPLTVSEAPQADWVKLDAEVVGPIDTTGDSNPDGYVFIYPISLVDYQQGSTAILGGGRILDSAPIAFSDHAWGLTPGARLATQVEVDAATGGGRASCGAYDGAGAELPNTAGTWSCGSVASPNGYPVVPLTVSGHSTAVATPFMADGSTPNEGDAVIFSDGIQRNGMHVLTGQVAWYLPASEVDAEIADPDNDSPSSAFFYNSIGSDGPSVAIASQDDVTGVAIEGSGGPADELRTVSDPGNPNNNTRISRVGVGAVEVFPGSSIGHNVQFLPGPLALIETNRWAPSRIGPDLRIVPEGGNWFLPGASLFFGDSSQDFIGGTPRGATVTISTQVNTNATEGSGTLWDAPIHGCTAFDTAHYNLAAFDAAIPVTEIDGSQTGNGNVVLGQYSIASNGGALAHVITGTEGRENNDTWRGQAIALGGLELPFEVQFTDAPIEYHNGASFGIAADALTCNDDDAGPSGWIDGADAAALAAAFDTATPGDGVYEGVTRARVRVTEHFPWESFTSEDRRSGFKAFFQARVRSDIAVNTANQELFALQSHSFGDLDANGRPDLIPYVGGNNSTQNCYPLSRPTWELNGNTLETSTGWCNNVFEDDGANSFDILDIIDWDNESQTVSQVSGAVSQFTMASGAVIKIVEASLALNKENVDGLGDVKDNGQLVQFSLRPAVVGAELEALTNVRLTDDLPSYYEFVQFVQQPSSPGASCTEASGSITCQFSEPNPSIDTGALPIALAGGWSDEIIIEVMVTGAIANPDSATVLTNTATARSTAIGPWDPSSETFTGSAVSSNKTVTDSASSYMPLPADEGAIIKAVDTLEGPCVSIPAPFAGTAAEWADRCSMIESNDDMSFVLSLTNEGNTAFSNIEIIDVFPHNLDGTEPASGTAASIDPQGSPSTLGDGRTPASDFAGTLGLVSMDPVTNAAGLVTYVSGDDPLTISRDPLVSFTDPATASTWCDGATVVAGPGTCPVESADVTATYSMIPGDLNPGETVELRLTLDTESGLCNDIWTNTFGARVDQILLPIRSNDVSIMVNCEFDLALEKTVDPVFAPGADWLTPGTTEIPFLIEVTNQGDPVMSFDVTDYVDTSVFAFDVAANADGMTAGSVNHPFTWDATIPAAPVVSVSGFFETGDTVLIPVVLTVEAIGKLENWAEISNFDSDDDQANGDAASGDLIDEDSTPDADQTDDAQPTGFGADGDGEIDGNGTGLAPDGITPDQFTGDEDDHDVAGLPHYDLELIKTAASPAVDFAAIPPTATYALTITNQGSEDVFLVDVTDYGAAGLTHNPAATAAAWTAAGLAGVTNANPTFTIAGPIAPAASVIIPLVYDIIDLSAAPFTNSAEIAAFDSDDDPANATDPFALDVDSTPDAIDDDEVLDHNRVNNDPDGDGIFSGPTPGDEDDHDIETIDPFATEDPAIDIEKDTNGVQSDDAPGETIPAGGAVTWTYVVTNTGGTALANATVTDSQGVTVSCDIDGDGTFEGTNGIPLLAIDASIICEGMGAAQPGPYENTADVSGDPIVPDWLTCGCNPADPATWPATSAGYMPLLDADGEPVAPVIDEDDSHYVGIVPEAAIDIEKDTNGVQSDEGPGEIIAAGDPVTWTYVVTNTGSTALGDSTVTDSQGVTVDCDIDGDGTFDGTDVISFLAIGGSVTCEGTGIAIDGPYKNNSTVEGNPLLPDFSTCGCDSLDPATWPTDPTEFTAAIGDDGEPLGPVADEDPSHYTGVAVIQLISGVVWNDANQDGIEDATETAHAGVLVELFDRDGNPVLDADGNPVTVVTNADGYYEFAVAPGDYRLRFTAPVGTIVTPGAGSDDDVDDTGLTPIISVLLGANVPDVDAGLVAVNSGDSAPVLAFTGTTVAGMVLTGLTLLVMGMFLISTTRRRKHLG